MTLRMVFEREDLQRVRVAAAPDPMWELVLSLHQVRERRLTARYVHWRQQAGDRIRRSDQARRWLSTLFTLVPPEGDFPDFLTPAKLVTELGAGCEAVACTPRGLLQADLRAVFAGRTAPGWVRALATADRGRLQDVVGAVRQAYDVLVAPHWTQVRDGVATDRAARVQALTEGGVGKLLAGIPSVQGWDGEALYLQYPVQRAVHLAGRGLTLVPSYFCSSNPITLIDPELSPVLVYPAETGEGMRPAAVEPSARLVALLGGTRAECLAILATPHTTSELADDVGTSVATASRQAAVLRDAGLITSERRGGAVLHHVTHLGSRLLVGGVGEL
ncbi:ArsR/SmtB family transcription factor [Saccharopolyspora sp. NPDC003752]